MKDVHSACAELAAHAAELALAIKSESDQNAVDDAWDSKLKVLYDALEDIKSYTEKIKRMSTLQRFLRQHSIHRELTQRRRLLKQAITTFEITSLIDIKQRLVHCEEQLNKILQAISPKLPIDSDEYEEDWRKIQQLSTQFRILRRCDVILSYSILNPFTPSDMVENYYNGEIIGQKAVTVKIYRSKSQQHLDEYKKDLELLMRVSHPSLSQLFGYSGPQKQYPFLVYYGVMHSYEYTQSTLKGVSRYKFAARMSSSFISAQGYLKSMNLNWSGSYYDMMVNSDSALWLEISTAKVRPFSEESFQDDIFAIIRKVTHKAVSPYQWTRTPSNDSDSCVTDATQELSEAFDEARKLKLDIGALWVELVMPGFIWEFGENVQEKWYQRSPPTPLLTSSTYAHSDTRPTKANSEMTAPQGEGSKERGITDGRTEVTC